MSDGSQSRPELVCLSKRKNLSTNACVKVDTTEIADDEEDGTWCGEIYEQLIETDEADQYIRAKFSAIDDSIESLLRDVQGGNSEAAALLHHMAKNSARALNQLEQQVLRPLAHREYLWPILMPACVKTKKDPRLQRLLELELGCFLPVDVQKFLRNETVARALVEHAIAIIMRLRSPIHDNGYSPPAPLTSEPNRISSLGLLDCDPLKSKPALPNYFALGDLTADTESINSWFPAIQAIILQQTNGHPTDRKFPLLRKIGEHHEKHGGAKPGSRTAEGNIEARFFECLKKALRTIVRQPKTRLSGQ